MIVRVTQEHIDRGVREDCRRCPIAQALGDATGEPWDVTDREATNLATFLSWDLPGEAARFISMFDGRSKDVQPFEFGLGDPQ